MPESPARRALEDDLQRGEYVAALMKLPQFKQCWKEVGRFVSDEATSDSICHLIVKSRWHARRLRGSTHEITKLAVEWADAARGHPTPEMERSCVKMLRNIEGIIFTLATVFFQMGLMVGFAMRCGDDKPEAKGKSAASPPVQ
jgi:hypothetical protein